MDPLPIRLAHLRRRLRAVITFRGSCLLLSAVLATVIFAGWVDWQLPGHLPSLVRAVILVMTLSGAGLIGYRFLFSPLFRRTDDLNLALQIEDLYPSLRDSLGSTVQFLKIPGDSQEAGSPALRRAAVQQTLKKVQDLNFNRVIDSRGVRTAGLSLVLCGSGAIALVLLHPVLARTALERLANPFGDREWPRQTQLELDGNTRSRIAKGSAFEIHGRVRGVIPEYATITYEGISPANPLPGSQAGAKERAFVLRDADSDIGILTARLDRVDRAFRFRVQANDALSDWYDVEVLPPPVLVPLDGRPSPQVRLHYPAYIDLPDLDLPDGSGNIEAVTGTRVWFRAAADRRLGNAWIEYRPDQPMAKLAAFLAPLGASHPGSTLALLAGGREVWDAVPVLLDPYGRKMTAEFTPHLSGLYALHFQDEEGIANTRLFELRIYADPAPVVTLERPAKSRDSLDLLPRAQFTLQASVEDREFAIRSVFLEYRCKKDDPPRRISLYDHRELGVILPQVMASLAGSTLPATPLRLRPQRLEVDRRLNLGQIRHLDQRPLKEGDVLTIQVCADDFDDVSIDKPPGRSHEVELRIISQAVLEANLNKEQKHLQEELLRLQKWQQEALQHVIGAEQRWRNIGRLEHRDIERLIQAEQLQEQIRGRVGTKDDGLQAEVDRILQTLRDNHQPASSIQERVEIVARELDRLAREELNQIEPRLTEARKENETGSESPRNASRGLPEARKGSLGEARQHQEEVENTLNSLLKLLEPWGHINQVKGEAKAILQEQQKLNEQTKALLKDDTGGSNRETLTPKQRAELDEAAKLQGMLEERSDQLLGRMERTAQEKDSLAKEKLKQALESVGGAKKRATGNSDLQKALDEAERAIEQASKALDEAGQAAGKQKDEKRQQAKEQRQQAQESLQEAQERDATAAKAIAEAADALAEANDLAEMAEPLQEASQIGREGNLKDEMKRARENISKNQQGNADEAQQKSIKNLQEMVKVLEERRENELERLQKKLKEAEQKLAEMAKEQERLRKKTQEAKQLANAEERERQLKELARQQEELRKKTQAMLKELNRYRAERARQALSGAAGNMEQAGQQLSRGQDPDEPQEEALDRLNDARRALQQEQKEIGDELARERLAKVSDQIKRLKERQEAAIAESKRLQNEALKNKEWKRAQLTSLGDLARVQEGLGKETQNLAEEKLKDAPVFARIMRKSAGSMEQAAERIKNHLEAIKDQPALLTPDKPAQKLQREALHRLEQLLDALKPEKGLAQGGGQQGGGQPGGGQQRGGARGDGIPPLAELKALRSLQKDINDLTESFGKEHPDRAKLTDQEKRELDGLSKEQKEIAELLDDLTKPADKEGADK